MGVAIHPLSGWFAIAIPIHPCFGRRTYIHVPESPGRNGIFDM